MERGEFFTDRPLDPAPYYWIIGISGSLVLSSFMLMGVGIAAKPGPVPVAPPPPPDDGGD